MQHMISESTQTLWRHFMVHFCSFPKIAPFLFYLFSAPSWLLTEWCVLSRWQHCNRHLNFFWLSRKFLHISKVILVMPNHFWIMFITHLIFFLLSYVDLSTATGEVMGCGGFVKSSKNIDLSRIQIGLFEKKNGNLRYYILTKSFPVVISSNISRGFFL